MPGTSTRPEVGLRAELSTSTTATASASGVNLEFLRALLPEAHEGHLITPEYHNALRDAILLLAQQSAPTLSGEGILTLAPTFHKNGDVREWEQANGVAGATLQDSTSGLLPVHLPEGAQLDSMTVIGKKRGAIDGFVVELKRQMIRGSQVRTTTIISVPLEDAPDSFEESADVLRQDYQPVSNNSYKYMIIADADNPAELAEIHTIQIKYSL